MISTMMILALVILTMMILTMALPVCDYCEDAGDAAADDCKAEVI